MQWTALSLKTEPNLHLAEKYETNEKQKKASTLWKKRLFSKKFHIIFDHS